MKPIIGICANYSNGLSEVYGRLGVQLGWHVIPDDYINSIEMAGGIPLIIPVYNDDNNIDSTINIIDGLLLTGGVDVCPKYYNEFIGTKTEDIDPKRDEHELHLLNDVITKSKVPILGICRGHQLLNVAYGGTLHQDLSEISLELKNNVSMNHAMYGSQKYIPVHEVELNKDSIFYEIFNKEKIQVNSYHHQVIKDVADAFNIVGRSPDGIVEAIEMKGDRFVIGTQWHPEMMSEHYEEQLLIFKKFVSMCAEYNKNK
ncbi:gamma-glutamyl-gamma-aminobutyrate hydrolase family protein [Clostridium sp. PL3]|uniref:Gamma-glutamyl-gamma-aminobutyrate hydrolase family protein n=1 Tax=Clostridium thailandense TaxID=2794346 RepID=A0A949TIR9_9CLOT|nr:gamma-glutamyl-gamma-aminobutyrate hydrolase family protein [Clostridium thailandense]MBV7271307.1 gamma-glutamyl-gamma-aminobutyrate hydrolase family protein [Clostridium thailandense]